MISKQELAVLVAIFITGFGVGMTFTAQTLKYWEIEPLREQAIESGCAHHDPKTGDFTWLNIQSK